jgi:hypothetical protein
MRTIMLAALLAGTFAGSSAFAQGSYVHHNFCLNTGGGHECAYDSMAQCETARNGRAGTCEQNTMPLNH